MHSRHLDTNQFPDSAGTTGVLQTVKEHRSFCKLVIYNVIFISVFFVSFLIVTSAKFKRKA